MEPKTNTVTSIESFNLVKNFQLIGRSLLLAEDVLTTYEIVKTPSGKILSRKKIDESSKQVSFEIKKVSLIDLENIRNLKTPSFVLKDGDSLYHAYIQDNISFVSSELLGKHKCGEPCVRLSPMGDEKGGCAKVRNRSQRIEKYPWIKLGFETFNTKHDSFVVSSCEHYAVHLPTTKPQPNKATTSL